jgi:hypothetical protein
VFRKVNRGLGKLVRLFRYNRLTLNLKRMEYVYLPKTRLPEVSPE